MSGGKYFEWILRSSDLNIGVSKKKYFLSNDRNLAPLCASEISLLNSVFGYNKDAAGNAKLYEYFNLLPPNFNLTLNSSDFSGC